MRLVPPSTVIIPSFLLFPTGSLDRFWIDDGYCDCEEASWRARIPVGVKSKRLTASSAESVRLVVTLTKAGGTLRYTQEQQSA